MRVTHWINVAACLALVVSGLAIALAHPRFYWGEDGYFDTAAAFTLPVPVTKGHTWWGRNVHFLAAWVAVLNGVAYLVWGFGSRHVPSRLVPHRGQLAWRHLGEVIRRHLRFEISSTPSGYNVLQKAAYLSVVFALLPLSILSGLTMSPGVTAAVPGLFSLFGGRQSARTIHFLATIALVLFVVVHVAMVWLTGFRRNMRAMITGGDAWPGPEEP